MVKIHLPLYAPAKPNAPPPPSHRTLKTTMPEHAPILPVIAAEVAALAPGFRARASPSRRRRSFVRKSPTAP